MDVYYDAYDAGIIDGIVTALIIGAIVGGILWVYTIHCGENFAMGLIGWIGMIIASIVGGILLLVPCAVIWFYLLQKRKKEREQKEKEQSGTFKW